MSFDIEREIYIKKLKNIVSGIEKINNIENSRIISNETRVELNNNKDKASKLLQKLEKGEFEIAVIGLEKAGKSSFSNAIKEIVIETTKFGSMKNAIMYDVPGFDSPTAMHRQQTLAKMRDVDAIIMVANAKAPSLRGPELDILKEKDMDGAPLYDKLFVFSNKADMVDSHEAFEIMLPQSHRL